MSLWSKTFGRATSGRPTAAAVREPEHREEVGEYQLLYKYLRDRYANRVVLTFGEIEDLLGFSLPESARLHREWWDSADATSRGSAQADSWTLAGRSAAVSMAAQSVVFDRESAQES